MGIIDQYIPNSTYAADSLNYATATLRASDILKVKFDMNNPDSRTIDLVNGTEKLGWIKAPSPGQSVEPWIIEITKRINQLSGLSPQMVIYDEQTEGKQAEDKRQARVGETIRILQDNAFGADVKAGTIYIVAKDLGYENKIEVVPGANGYAWTFRPQDYEIINNPATTPDKTKGYKMATLKAKYAIDDLVQLGTSSYGKVSEIRFVNETETLKNGKTRVVAAPKYVINGSVYKESQVTSKFVEAKR